MCDGILLATGQKNCSEKECIDSPNQAQILTENEVPKNEIPIESMVFCSRNGIPILLLALADYVYHYFQDDF